MSPEKRKAYRVKNAVELARKAREYNARRPDVSRKFNLKVAGFTPELYALTFRMQHGRCAICDENFDGMKKRNVHADHDHKTGLARGILCSKCNRGIGFFHDNPNKLAAAIKYLTEPPLALG